MMKLTFFELINIILFEWNNKRITINKKTQKGEGQSSLRTQTVHPKGSIIPYYQY